MCKINHIDSSGAMEKEAIVEMFVNSIQRRTLKYVEYVGDGDTNSFAALVEKSGIEYKCNKEDCVGHVQ